MQRRSEAPSLENLEAWFFTVGLILNTRLWPSDVVSSSFAGICKGITAVSKMLAEPRRTYSETFVQPYSITLEQILCHQ